MKRSSLFLSIGIAVLIILIGYYKLFLGYNFFVHEDWVAVSGHTAGNKFSNGWRPDKGLGLSYFYGDPAMWHPWSLLSFWERVMPDRTAAYDSSVVIFDIAVVVAWIVFIRRFFPKIDHWLTTLLVPLMVFCFDASAQHYARAFITLAAVIPLFLWLLHDYYERPRWLHITLAPFVWWATAFTGNLWSLTQLLSMGFIFSVLYTIHFKVRWSNIFKKFLVLHAVGLTMFVLLGAWVFYSFGLDQTVVGYAREKPIVLDSLRWFPEIKTLLRYLLGFIPFVGIPLDQEFAAFQFLPYHHGVSVVFIFIFLYYLGKRSDDFWPFVLKWLLIIFFLHGICVDGKLLPAYSTIYGFISNKTSKLISMYGFVYCLQTAMIVHFVSSLRPENVVTAHVLCRRIQQSIAAPTVVLYACVLMLSLLGYFFPQQYLGFVDHWVVSKLPSSVGGYSKELLAEVLSYNARRYLSLIDPALLGFFMTSIVIAGVFLNDRWLRWVAGRSKIMIASALLANAFLLSWSIYPLNNRPMAWDRPALKAIPFEPTDRFYFVRSMRWGKTPEGFRKKYVDLDGGYRKSQIGLLEPPGINISGFKSFTSKSEAEFMGRVFHDAGFDYRRLYYGADFVYSDLLDMAAVKYYYSDGSLEDRPSHIVPFAQDGQIYIYKNTRAWPYYYLAQKTEHLSGPINDPMPGTAYLGNSDQFQLSSGSGHGDVRLNKFGYGDMTFDVNDKQEEFLVVADSWHPFWKARTSSGKDLKIYKVNEVFKGVRLEPGKYEMRLSFDTKPYQPGIWISLFAWMALVWTMVLASRDRNPIAWLKEKRKNA